MGESIETADLVVVGAGKYMDLFSFSQPTFLMTLQDGSDSQQRKRTFKFTLSLKSFYSRQSPR